MRVSLHDRLGQPVEFQATRVVVYDHLGNPMMVALEHLCSPNAPPVYIYSTAEHDDFNHILHAMGINKTIIVSQLDTPPPEIQA